MNREKPSTSNSAASSLAKILLPRIAAVGIAVLAVSSKPVQRQISYGRAYFNALVQGDKEYFDQLINETLQEMIAAGYPHEAVKLYKKSDDKIKTLLRIATNYEREGNLEAAAYAYEEAGETEKARRLFLRAAASARDPAYAAQLYEKAGEPDKAKEANLRAGKEALANISWGIERVKDLLRKGGMDEGTIALRLAAALAKNDEYKNYRVAAEYFEKATGDKSELSDIAMKIAQAALEDNDYGLAKKFFAKAGIEKEAITQKLLEHAKNTGRWLALFDLYKENGIPEKQAALQIAREAAQRHDYGNAAFYYGIAGDHAQAREQNLNLASSIKWTDPANAAAIFRDNGKPAEANDLLPSIGEQARAAGNGKKYQEAFDLYRASGLDEKATYEKLAQHAAENEDYSEAAYYARRAEQTDKEKEFLLKHAQNLEVKGDNMEEAAYAYKQTGLEEKAKAIYRREAAKAIQAKNYDTARRLLEHTTSLEEAITTVLTAAENNGDFWYLIYFHETEIRSYQPGRDEAETEKIKEKIKGYKRREAEKLLAKTSVKEGEGKLYFMYQEAARYLQDIGESQRANEALLRAAQEAEKVWEYRDAARLYRDVGDNEKAQECDEQAVFKDEWRVDNLDTLDEAYRATGLNDNQILLRKAFVSAEYGRFEKAAEYYEKAGDYDNAMRKYLRAYELALVVETQDMITLYEGSKQKEVTRIRDSYYGTQIRLLQKIVECIDRGQKAA